jgi:hypothetical protein
MLKNFSLGAYLFFSFHHFFHCCCTIHQIVMNHFWICRVVVAISVLVLSISCSVLENICWAQTQVLSYPLGTTVFRSQQSGRWTDSQTWQVFRSGVWVSAAASGLIPNASSSVFIETGHTVSATNALITVSSGLPAFNGSVETAFVECLDLHISTAGSITTTWAGYDMSANRPYPAHELRVYGKIRSYMGEARTLTDQPSTIPVPKTCIGAGSTLVFRKVSRNSNSSVSAITARTEWNALDVPNYGTGANAPPNAFYTAIFDIGVASDTTVTGVNDNPSLAVATITDNFVAGNIIVKRGTLRFTGGALMANEGYSTSGTMQVLNNAVLQLDGGGVIARTVKPSPQGSVQPASRLRFFSIEDGGAFDVVASTASLSAADVRFNGTVLYSGATDQSLLSNTPTVLPSGENGDNVDPYRLSSAVTNYSSLTLRGTGRKTFPDNVTVSRAMLMQGQALAAGQAMRFLRSTGVGDGSGIGSTNAIWSVNGGNTAAVTNLGIRTASLPSGLQIARSTNREQIDMTPPRLPIVDAATVRLGNGERGIVPAPNTLFDTPINTTATTTLQYESEISNVMSDIEFPSGVQGPHNLVINCPPSITQKVLKEKVLQGPEYTNSLNGHLPRIVNGGAAASAYLDTRPNLPAVAATITNQISTIPTRFADSGLRPQPSVLAGDGRVRRFEDGGRRGDMNNFGVLELRSGLLEFNNELINDGSQTQANMRGFTYSFSTVAIISQDMAKVRNPQAASESPTSKRAPAGPANLSGSLKAGANVSLVFNGGRALYLVAYAFNNDFTEIPSRSGVKGTGAEGFKPNTPLGLLRDYNLGPEKESIVDGSGTVLRANNAYNVDLPLIAGGIGNLTMIRATSNVLTLCGNNENTGNGITSLDAERLAGLVVYGTIATARGCIDLNGRNIELIPPATLPADFVSSKAFLTEAFSLAQITEPSTGKPFNGLSPYATRASFVFNSNPVWAYIGVDKAPSLMIPSTPGGIDEFLYNVSGLGARVYIELGNNEPWLMGVRRWHTNTENALRLGQGITPVTRFYQIDMRNSMAQFRRVDLRLQYTEDELNGVPEDSLMMFRSGTLDGPWTVLENVRQYVGQDRFSVYNALTTSGTFSTQGFNPVMAKYWAMGGAAFKTSVPNTPTSVGMSVSEADVIVRSVTPNPASDMATIRYEVREHSFVELSIVDMLGKKIATLADHHHLAGEYTLHWQTQHLPAGAYLLRMQSKYGVTYKRLNVVR